MPKPPIVPGGRTVNAFGFDVMRWGTGDEAARERMVILTREYLVSKGVTAEMARAWRDFYINEVERSPRNPSARGRVELMQRALDLLEDSND